MVRCYNQQFPTFSHLFHPSWTYRNSQITTFLPVMGHGDGKKQNKNMRPNKSSWWFQALWKIWSSKWESSPMFGVKIKNIKKTPTRNLILQVSIRSICARLSSGMPSFPTAREALPRTDLFFFLLGQLRGGTFHDDQHHQVPKLEPSIQKRILDDIIYRRQWGSRIYAPQCLERRLYEGMICHDDKNNMALIRLPDLCFYSE